jgi:ParB-like chromosome segregation protein Spo0J
MTKTTLIDRSVLISKSLLDPNPWNPNKTKPRQQQAIAESLATYSQILDIIVRPIGDRYQIIDGEHRYDELTDEVYVTVLHGLSDADAKKLTIVLNETRGEADKIELAQLLANLSEELEGDELLNALPYEQSELDELVKLAQVDWDNFNSTEKEEPDFKGESDPTQDDFVKIVLVLPKDAFPIAEQAKELISQERELNKNKEIAWGQVLESLAADYISGANYAESA